MRELNLHEINVISGGNNPAEIEIAINSILTATIGYAGSMGFGFDPFYPTLIAAAYGFVVSAYEYATK